MLSDDYDLKKSDIQQLSGADAVTGLFTAFGYGTDQRIRQTPEAMGFSDALAREVMRIERIADQEQGALQIYLVEMKHVTVKLTQDLARVFKNRAGLFLLVLTTQDYEHLDFVLLQHIGPETQRVKSGINAPQAVLRPRILSVERRNPDRVGLRVLRRFSFTEVDVDYQWEKLLSAYSVAEWSEPQFNNRALFSDYYLNERLPQRPDWKEDPRPAYRAISDLLVDVRQKFARQAESKIRADLLEPVLKVLGWTIMPGKSAQDDRLSSDYSLQTPSGETIPCLAYAWDRALDGMDEQRDADTPTENPAQTVVSILEDAKMDSPGWAIVTNGKTWRLYSARAHSRATNYYEIDLEETLASPDAGEAFRYFWLLFRAKAFGGQPSFVDLLLAESASYAKALGERLKDNVFENVFPRFAEGFVKTWGKPATDLSEDELSETFHATLTFLYRLLFLLYAEARDLLPVKETRGYWEISLSRMKQEIAQKAGDIADLAPEKLKAAYPASETGLYDRLSALFAVIDKGRPELNVPVYNGGLFITQTSEVLETSEVSDEVRAARFLSIHKIPDRFLAQGLDLLARDIDEKTQALAMIDYKSLGVRQLGSIYEGLLEFKLRVAREKMAVTAGKKGDEVVPYAEAVKKSLKIRQTGKGSTRAEFVIHKGEIYLENDRHERKASGSYYTPDYIVKYIVQNTVGPALEAKSEGLRPKLREAQKTYNAAVERRKLFQKMGQKGDDPEKTAYTFRNLVDELFDLRVLDPAMGSGHFLVEAVDFITDRLLAFLNAFPWNPVTAALRQTRQTILDEMQRQGVSVDPARLTDVNLLKRHVLKRCVYGVDLNPMAVELAKVSLWLDCFTLGAPLSFLDHHLKCGNSLIGAQVTPVREEIEMVTTTRTQKVAENAQAYKTKRVVAQQFQMFGSLWTGAMLATDLMRQVGELPDTTAEQVHQSRTEYARAMDALAPFKRILDVYTSRWFGNPDGKLSQPALQFLRDEQNIPWLKDPKHNPPASVNGYREIAETSIKATREKRFFHWELEFPEVFFGPSKASAQEIALKENPGFDAVIGNPPYDELSEDALGTIIDEKPFLDVCPLYKPAQESGGRANWYHFFMILGVRLVKNSCDQSFIVPMSWIGDTFTSGVRNWILKNHRPIQIDCFPQKDDPKNRIFEAAKLPTAIYVSQKDRKDGYIKVRRHPGKDILNIAFYEVDVTILDKLNPGMAIIPITSVVGWEILKSVATSEKLGSWGEFAAQPTSGEIIFNDDTRPYMTEDSSFDLILRGGHVQRYELLDDARQGTPIFLKTAQYLAASRGNSKAFDHKMPRVVYQEGSAIDAWRRVVSTYLPAGYICGHKVCYFVDYKVDSLCLLAVFNSKLVNWLVESLSATNSLPAYLVSSLPFPKFSFTTPAARRVVLVKEAQNLASLEDLSGLLAFVLACLQAQPEESDVVHDLLAFLAQRMIDLNKQKQSEMKRFISWLEGLLKVNVDALTGKSKLKNYLGDYQKGESELSYAELEDILYKNKSKLGLSLSDSRFTSKLREEFEGSLKLLHPIKASLAWTDALIDQVVYRLYRLEPQEIAIIEGKEQKPEPVKETPATVVTTPGKPQSIARESDPNNLAKILQILGRQGALTIMQLSDALADLRISFQPDKAETIRREFEFLKWIEPGQAEWVLTERGKDLASMASVSNMSELARQLCVDNDRYNQQVVSRLLQRMWQLSPDLQGAIVVPKPGFDPLPESLDELKKQLRANLPKWSNALQKQIPNFRGLENTNTIADGIIRSLETRWKKMPLSDKLNRLQTMIGEAFVQVMFGHVMSPNDVEIWQNRMDWAGITHTARDLPGVQGQVWFPVGAFRDSSDGFTAVAGLRFPDDSATIRLYHRYTPVGSEYEKQFMSALYEGYRRVQKIENVEYVSLLAVRDWVCYRLRISHEVFEQTLQSQFPRALRSEIPYSLALEVDISHIDLARLGNARPVVIDGNPRYIISMRSRG